MILYTSIILDAAKTMVYLGICFLGKFPDFVLAFDELKMWAYTHGYRFYKNIRLKARIAIFPPLLPRPLMPNLHRYAMLICTILVNVSL